MASTMLFGAPVRCPSRTQVRPVMRMQRAAQVTCHVSHQPKHGVPTASIAPQEVVAEVVEERRSFLQHPIFHNIIKFLGVAALGLVLMFSAPAAEAARSGGRMGGSSFGGYSRSGPSMSSGMGSGMGSGIRSGGGYGSYGSQAPSLSSRGSVTVRPSFGIGMPLFGYGYGAPVYSSGGSSFFSIIVFAIFALVLVNTLSGMTRDTEDDYDEEDAGGREPMSVVKIQVGLLGSARQLQRDLNRMANRTDTSTPAGLHYLLQETVLALRRNPQYAVYGKAMLTKTRGLDNAEAQFNQMSMEERGKFESETLSNFSGRTSRGSVATRGDGLNELIVVTIIAAVDGKLEPVDIRSVDDLKNDLSLLGSIPASRLLALEVLWTPQEEDDYFTKDQLVEDYPLMNTI